MIYFSSQLQTYYHKRNILEEYLNKKLEKLKYLFLNKLRTKEKITFCGLTFSYEQLE